MGLLMQSDLRFLVLGCKFSFIGQLHIVAAARLDILMKNLKIDMEQHEG